MDVRAPLQRTIRGIFDRDVRAPLQRTIHNAHQFAITHQYTEGYWRGSDESNNTMEAEFLFINYFLGLRDPIQTQKLVKRILESQREDGTWGIYYGSPGELSTSVEC